MISLKIDGLDKLRGNYGKANEFIRKEIKDAMVEAVGQVKNSAQDLSPYDTGTLRRSIFTDVSDDGFEGIVAQDGNIAVYGPAQEYGTIGMQIRGVSKLGTIFFYMGGIPPHPYMQPAFEQNLSRIKDLFNQAIKNVINSITNS